MTWQHTIGKAIQDLQQEEARIDRELGRIQGLIVALQQVLGIPGDPRDLSDEELEERVLNPDVSGPVIYLDWGFDELNNRRYRELRRYERRLRRRG